MKKVEINLYPYQAKEENKFIKEAEKYTPFAFLGILVFVVINFVIFSITVSLSFSCRKLTSEWKRIQPEAARISKLNKELSSLIARDKECRLALGHKVNASHILADIYASLPENIWLEKIYFDKESILISGYAVSWKESPLISIDTLVKNLKETKYFHDAFHKISLKSSRKVLFNTKEVMKFEVECGV